MNTQAKHCTPGEENIGRILGMVGKNKTKMIDDKHSKGAVYSMELSQKTQWWDCRGGSFDKSLCCVSMKA